jgi:DNA invertase Pin-like site-specific DNA recombinase
MLAIYARLSNEDEESNSIDNQIKEGKAYASLNSYKESDVIIYDEGEGVKGSTPIDNRPELLRMVNDIKSGKIKLIWMRKQNRVSRKNIILEEFLKLIIDYNVMIFFGDRGLLDLSLPATKMTIQIMGAVDEYAPNAQSLETKKALLINAKEGKVWGTIPYGYNRDDDKKAIEDDYEGDIIRRIFKESLAGSGTMAIAMGLNTDKIPTKSQRMAINAYKSKKVKSTRVTRDKTTNEKVVTDKKDIKWVGGTVYDILNNKWYIGIRSYDGVEYNVIPPIVSKKLFYDVKDNFKKNSNATGKKVTYRYLLKGLLKCEKCGRNYNGARKYNSTNTPSKYLDNYYMCSGKKSINHMCDNNAISITMIESFIIKHLFKSKDLLKYLKNIDKYDDGLQALQDDLIKLKAQLKEETNKGKNLAEIIVNKGITSNERFIEMLNTTDNNIKTINSKIEATSHRIDARENANRVKNYQTQLDEYNDNWNFEQYKEAVNNIIESVKIRGGISPNETKKKVYFILKINYKGFDEYSMFITSRPYKTWYWKSKIYTEPTAEDIEEDNELFKYLHKQKTGEDITIPKGEHHKISDWYDNAGDDVELTKEDILDFD